MFKNVRVEWWYLLVPFLVVLIPPLGLALLAAALWRAGGGIEGHRLRTAERRYNRVVRARRRAERAQQRAERLAEKYGMKVV